jgi:hypothetical protein
VISQIIILINKVSANHKSLQRITNMRINKLTSAVALSLVALGNAQASNETWNILSLDGGGIRGLITATVVDYMEGYAY